MPASSYPTVSPGGTEVVVNTPVRQQRNVAADFLSPTPGATSSDRKPCIDNSWKPMRRDQDRYPQEVCEAFGVDTLDSLVWAHAVNNRNLLGRALHNPEVHFMEVDVSWGTYRRGKILPFNLCDSNARKGGSEPRELKQVKSNQIVAAHYPTQRSSDLLISDLIQILRDYNRSITNPEEEVHCGSDEEASCTEKETGCVLEGDETSNTAASSSTPPEEESLMSSPLCPAKVNSADNLKDLTQISRPRPRQHHVMPSNADESVAESKLKTKRIKGLKLDFKHWQTVEPTLKLLAAEGCAEDLPHVWLNADVLSGPGGNTFQNPIPAVKFVQACAKWLPGCVLSLGWTHGVTLSRGYSAAHLDSMIELCMSPHVQKTPRPESTSSESTARREPPPAFNIFDERVAIVSKAKHITFSVCAFHVQNSKQMLKALLEKVPNSSLTVWTGSSVNGVTFDHKQKILAGLDEKRLFIDMPLIKNRGCTDNVVQECAIC